MAWCVKDNAGLRPALFFCLSNIGFKEVSNKLDKLLAESIIEDSDFLLCNFQEFLFSLLNSFWGPIVIKEMSKANLGHGTKKEKYKNFFLSNDLKWTKNAINTKNKHSFVFERISELIKFQIKYFIDFLNHYQKDYKNIIDHFKWQNVALKKLDFNISDLHNYTMGCIILTFSNNQKILYKPKSPFPEIFFQKYIDILNLQKPFDILAPKIITSHKNYYWQEFLKQTKTNNASKLAKFYKNFGSVLAVMDSLNYSDGHKENFIASNSRLIPVDLETMFTNYSYYHDKKDYDGYLTLAFTGIIRFYREAKSQRTLRSKDEPSYFPISPTLLNDNTSDISMRYRIIKNNDASKSFPGKEEIRLLNYKSDIVTGMEYAYSQIRRNNAELLKLAEKNKTLILRQVKRPTLYYTWLIHKFLHPSTRVRTDFLRKNLSNYNEKIAKYEYHLLQDCNVPVFYHAISSRHLISYDNSIIEKNHFSDTALNWFKKKIKDISSEDFVNQRKDELSKAIK